MIKDHVNAVIPLAIGDYPAAHSMDTTWFAVDENGEIGRFEMGEGGAAPMLEGMEPPTPEEQVRREYSKAFDYSDQYRAIQKHYEKERDKDSKPQTFHDYAQDGDRDSLYYWLSSPEKVITLDELPLHLQNGRHLLHLKDYDFRSREPINIYDYAAGCYAEWGRYLAYPDGYAQTKFPIQAPWSMQAFKVCQDEGCSGRGFFAMDEAGRLALFRTDRFGAIPLEKISGSIPAIMENYDTIFRMHPGPRYDDILRLRDVSDVEIWMELVRGGAEEKSHPILAVRKEAAEQAWKEKGPAHWLEYPFGPASPRWYGLYHYDASWHHPLPYLRIGAPEEPLNFGQLDDELRERMKPVLLPGIRFDEAARVQPFELIPCFSASIDSIDEDFGWKFPQVWIDASLENIHRCHEFSVFNGSIALLLRRAQRHVERIEQLARA